MNTSITMSNARRSAIMVALAAVIVTIAVIVGSMSAFAAPSGKGKPTPKPTPTATATATPTPTPTVTTQPDSVQLSCTLSGDYVIARYTSEQGYVYQGAVLTDGTVYNGDYVLATFGTMTYTKFMVSLLPPADIIPLVMKTSAGQPIASCIIGPL